MQVYGDYIYYDSEGGYTKVVSRYNIKTNTIEQYPLPEEITKARISYPKYATAFFIRDDNMYYQPYSEDFFFIINLKTNAVTQTKKLEKLL